MSAYIADYTPQREAIRALWQQDCAKRILLLRGDSGSGKTHLVNACREDMPGSVRYIPGQLRGAAVSVAEIFSRAGSTLGWGRLKNLTRQVAEMAEGPRVKIDRNWLVGIKNHIQVALQAESISDRHERRAQLTDAWFEDLRICCC